MNLSAKRRSIVALIVLLIVMLCMSAAVSGTNFGLANEVISDSYASFQMEEGAQTRVDDKKAIRFVTKISQSELDVLVANHTVEVVTMITPARYLDRVGLNSSEGFVKDCSVKKEEIVFSQANGNLTANLKGGFYYFNACLFGVLDNNITQDFAARSYLLIDGNLAGYTAYSAEKNNRSIYEVALNTKTGYAADTDAYKNLDAISSGVYAEEYGITVNGIDGKTLELTATYGQPLYAFTKQFEQTFNKEGAYYWTGEIVGENEFTESTPITQNGMEVNAKFISLTFVEDGDGYAVDGASRGFYDMTSTVKIPETFNGKPVKAIYKDAFTSGVKEIHIPEGVIINANAFNGVYPTIIIGENTFTYKANATKVDYMSYRVDGNGELVFYDDFIEIAYAYDNNYIPVPTPADIVSGSAWRTKYEKYVGQDTDVATLTTPELWWMEIYNNSDNISVEDKQACYYVKGLNDKSLTTVTIPETFDDGVHGELPVKYIGKGAFMSNTTITKVFATETLTELRGTAFSGASNLQVAVFPGVKYLADIRNSSGTIWMRENFNYCDKLTKLVVGGGFTLSGTNFKPTASTSSGWYTISTYYYGEKGGFDYTNWKGEGYLLSDTKRYAYAEVCDGSSYWHFDVNGEPELSLTTHQYVEGKCTVCGAIEMTTVAYAYDANFIPMPTPAEIADANSAWRATYEKYVPDTVDKTTLTTPDLWWKEVYNNRANIATEDFVKCYYVTGLVDTTLTEVRIAATFNDGTNGELPVRYAKSSAFEGNTIITKVFATENLTELRGRVFASCSSLRVVVLPGVKYISSLYQDTASPLMHSQNFNGVASSSQIVKLVVGDDFTDAGVNFKPSSASYENKIHLYVYGDSRTLNASYWSNWQYRGYSDSKWFKYDETGLLEGKYWHFDENGEPVHNVHVDSGADGKCDTCGDAVSAA